ncbi:MAG: hypothetical protein H6832_13365 [Planctomycetes bacterium]|nr:hypothetical protein [Planctomycetota bacterium]MCB9919385.1 hypothetical protein [Planctomycetota bacterium]
MEHSLLTSNSDSSSQGDTTLERAFARSGHSIPDESIAARNRGVELFGRSFELSLVPSRADRSGIPGRRAAFRTSAGPRIRAEEGFWSDGHLVATPNRFPFLGRSFLLWNAHGSEREVGASFLARAFELCDAENLCLLANTVGASASIPLAHAHVTWTPRPLLYRAGTALDSDPASTGWPTRVVAMSNLGSIRATTGDDDWPCMAVEVRAPDPRVRAAWIAALLATRTTAAANLLVAGERALVVPRRAECGLESFPLPIGASELSGRWIFADEFLFENAIAPGDGGLEASLRAACVPTTATELEGVTELAVSLVDASV